MCAWRSCCYTLLFCARVRNNNNICNTKIINMADSDKAGSKKAKDHFDVCALSRRRRRRRRRTEHRSSPSARAVDLCAHTRYIFMQEPRHSTRQYSPVRVVSRTVGRRLVAVPPIHYCGRPPLRNQRRANKYNYYVPKT